MKKFNLIFWFCFLLGSLLKAQSNIYSFENGLKPDEFSCQLGSLEVSGQQYKLGGNALCWSWKPSDVLSVVRPLNLVDASKLSGGGLTTWIYNDTPNHNTTSNNTKMNITNKHFNTKYIMTINNKQMKL